MKTRLDISKEEIIEIIDSTSNKPTIEVFYELLTLGIREINDIDIAEKIIQNKAYLLLKLCSTEIILKKIDGKTILEIMIENNVDLPTLFFDEIKKLVKMIEVFKPNSPMAEVFGIDDINPIQTVEEAIINLYKKGKIKELSNLNSAELLSIRVEENKILMDVLLEHNLEPELYGEISDPQIIRSIIAHKKTQYYHLIDPYLVFNQYDDNNTFMDIIMKHKEEDNSISVRIPSTTSRTKAQIIIEYVKHGFKQEIGLRISQLFESNHHLGKTLLDYLLDEDREFTLTKLISEKALQDPRVKAGIMLYDFKGNVFSAGSIRERFETRKLEEYRAMPVTEEQEQLLDKLREVLSDEKSDPKLVDMIVFNYRRLFAENNPCAYEVNHIIEMKEKDSKFSVVSPMPNGGNSYNSALNSITIRGLNVKAFNHEIGHALFENISHRHVPKEFIEIIERIVSDEEHLKKVYEHSLAYQNAKATIHTRATVMIDEEFAAYVTEQQIAEIDKMLRKLELNSEEIKKIFARHAEITATGYIEKEKEIRRKECEALLLENTYYNLTSISDILDAIYRGKYIDKCLEYNGQIICGEWGHGQEYYMIGTELIFNEILADYSRIIKSPNPQEGIEMLTYYVGEELVDFLNRYYQEHILDATINELENDYGRENERRFRI